jgi:hypothetical protein
MATREQVVNAWVRGLPATTGNRSLSTNGKELFSYRLTIGVKLDGSPVVLDYTASADQFMSQTTSTHVRFAARSANDVMHPDAYYEAFPQRRA